MLKSVHFLPLLLLLLAGPLPKALAQKPRHPSPPALATQERSGTLLRYTANPEGLYDGFIYQAGGTQDSVHFLPDLAESLMTVIKPGQSIHFTTTQHQLQEGGARRELVSVKLGKKTLVMALPPPPPPAPPVPGQTPGEPPMTPPPPPPAPPLPPVGKRKPVAVEGRITALRNDRQGHLRAIMLADQTLLTVPPHVGVQLADKLKTGTTLQATGLPLELHRGAVAADKLRRIHALTLTVDNVQFLIN
ncbi:hypothetical protein [Hymenobacter chitinivorans]|uniref:Uncharacterized protein n=1 Tax=Hymenobacter chitinivorans DSM 11115 TaxID=1121954 RepID=A0A2M9B525_9BACT|nr:hypothetical protein [Hymenobacter chitinivorans]PJJ53034.1 hypothetical protein CLV45_3692 [Hymenobacter chitinivorans DSM 11115]